VIQFPRLADYTTITIIPRKARNGDSDSTLHEKIKARKGDSDSTLHEKIKARKGDSDSTLHEGESDSTLHMKRASDSPLHEKQRRRIVVHGRLASVLSDPATVQSRRVSHCWPRSVAN
jgi:hypothetical protein